MIGWFGFPCPYDWFGLVVLQPPCGRGEHNPTAATAREEQDSQKTERSVVLIMIQHLS